MNKSKLNNQNRLNIQNLREKFKLHPKDIENYKPVWFIENFSC
ncbi:hypothetical protein [Campylobacter blaseri]|nr:hypothetical protein [Campylobacter blaseri]